MKKWIKIPTPGQFRGEGEWQEVVPAKARMYTGFDQMDAETFYNYCKAVGYLPTAEQDEKPT